jgi:hypothetical protein
MIFHDLRTILQLWSLLDCLSAVLVALALGGRLLRRWRGLCGLRGRHALPGLRSRRRVVRGRACGSAVARGQRGGLASRSACCLGSMEPKIIKFIDFMHTRTWERRKKIKLRVGLNKIAGRVKSTFSFLHFFQKNSLPDGRI